MPSSQQHINSKYTYYIPTRLSKTIFCLKKKKTGEASLVFGTLWRCDLKQERGGKCDFIYFHSKPQNRVNRKCNIERPLWKNTRVENRSFLKKKFSFRILLRKTCGYTRSAVYSTSYYYYYYYSPKSFCAFKKTAGGVVVVVICNILYNIVVTAKTVYRETA